MGPSVAGAKRTGASRTGHGALLGVPVALSLAVGTVENVRVCGWLFGK